MVYEGMQKASVAVSFWVPIDPSVKIVMKSENTSSRSSPTRDRGISTGVSDFLFVKAKVVDMFRGSLFSMESGGSGISPGVPISSLKIAAIHSG